MENNTKTLSQFKDEHYGKRGTAKRDKLEAGYKNCKAQTLVSKAKLKKD